MGGQKPRQVRRLVDQIKAKTSMFNNEQEYFIKEQKLGYSKRRDGCRTVST